MISKEETEKYIEALRVNEDLCLAICSWMERECLKLENPKWWNMSDFEIDGKSSLKAAKKLRLLISKLTTIKIDKLKEVPKRTSYS